MINKIELVDSQSILKYIKVNKENFETAYNIQKQIWVDEPDFNNFKQKCCKIYKCNWNLTKSILKLVECNLYFYL